MSGPLRWPAGVQAATVGDDTIVVAGDALHVLNPSAAAVWRACADAPDPGAVAVAVAAEYAVDVGTVAGEVDAAVAALAERGLVLRGDAPRTPVPVLEPVPVCASCGDGPAYECHVVVPVAGALLTLGADAELAGALAAALGPEVGVVADPGTRPSYGVVVPPRVAADGRQDVARLHRGPDVVLRARRPERVVEALLTLVAHHRTDPPRLDALAVGDGDRVVLLAPPANRVAFERALAPTGLAVADLPTVGVAGTAVDVGPVGLDVDRGPLGPVLAGRATARTEPATLAAGRYEVAALLVAGPPAGVSVLAEMGPARTATRQSLTVIERLADVGVRRGTAVADVVAALAG